MRYKKQVLAKLETSTSRLIQLKRLVERGTEISREDFLKEVDIINQLVTNSIELLELETDNTLITNSEITF